MSVSKNGPLIDPGLCRCCRAIKRCRILTAEYNWMGQKEVYSDMIMDCFGILLSNVDESEIDLGVCATCVVRLRDACAFRLQVLQSEEMFLHSKLEDKEAVNIDVDMNEQKKKEDVDMKVEPKEDCSDHNSLGDREDVISVCGDNICGVESADDPEDLKPLKQETKQDNKPLIENDVMVKLALDDILSNCSSDEPLTKITKKKRTKTKSLNGVKKKSKKRLKESRKRKERALKKEKISKKMLASEKRNTYDRELDCMAEENLLTIIEFSYACPFKNRRNNYYCFYCKDYFAKPEDLRAHTLSHDTKPFPLLMGYKKMPKLDITRIDCRLCSEPITDLDTFKTHVDKDHGKKIYFEAPDKFLVYRLTWNDLVCVMCNNMFEDFNTLNVHMVEHFSNFTCDVCGVCFLEKTRLDAHLKRHKDDERHTCEICGKVFKSNHYKDMHVDIVHKKKAIIRCPKCDQCFMSYALKNRHLTEAHGQKRTYPCNLCDKVYNRQKTLTEHQRRNHQKVMKHHCEYCDQRFYLPSRLKEHMATHTGERNFHCEMCDKSYPRLKSLQYHIRTHTNDRRYRCHVCGQAFIQNASLKSHIKSHHPECDIDGCYF